MTTKQKIIAVVLSTITLVACMFGVYKFVNRKSKHNVKTPIDSKISNELDSETEEGSGSEGSVSDEDEDKGEGESEDEGGEEGSENKDIQTNKTPEINIEDSENQIIENDENDKPLQPDDSSNAALIQAGQDVQSEILNNKSSNTENEVKTLVEAKDEKNEEIKGKNDTLTDDKQNITNEPTEEEIQSQILNNKSSNTENEVKTLVEAKEVKVEKVKDKNTTLTEVKTLPAEIKDEENEKVKKTDNQEKTADDAEKK
ncbi:MAG: hypothetical protein IJI84_03610 [Clostridia bacterium]|nr:hypothetical protein [Clostridia bacterium]